jgi:small subunit ribosomal protein S20
LAKIIQKGVINLPQRKTAAKRLRVDRKKRLHNLKIKTELKKTIKKFLSLLLAKKLDEAKEIFKQVVVKLDKAVNKGIIHKNTAARKKSRFSKKLARTA